MKNEKHRTVFHSILNTSKILYNSINSSGGDHQTYAKFLNYVNHTFLAKEVGDTALLLACAKGDLAAVQYLLSKGADPNITNDSNHTGIMVAAQHGHQYIVKYLAKMGGDIHAQDTETGNNALLISIQAKQWIIAKHLIDLRAKINIQNNAGRTALMEAVVSEDSEAMSIIDNVSKSKSSRPPLIREFSNRRYLSFTSIIFIANIIKTSLSYIAQLLITVTLLRAHICQKKEE